MKKIFLFICISLLLVISGIYFVYPLSKHQVPHGIILISLDTLRADHLGIYGYHRNTSPSIDAFAKECVIFNNAVVQAPTTLPSHMSIMTSLYPSSHGVKKNTQRLEKDHLTLAELLRNGGYRTAAFTDGGMVSGAFGFDQGFEIYDDHGGGIASILPKVKNWIEKHKSDPFFLFIHCYDIHSPYNPPPSYVAQFHNFKYTGQLVPNGDILWKAHLNQLKVNSGDVQHLMAFYDGGIRYTDEKMGDFFSYLREVGLFSKSLIIITSDHGEEFKEHGSFLHWQLYYCPNLHVPLIMCIPGYNKKEIRIEQLVQSIDILPTVLEIAELPDHPTAQGESLFPLIKKYKNSFELILGSIMNLLEKDPKISFAEFFNNSIIQDGYQMIIMKSNDGTYSIELYNLLTDPLEQKDLSKVHDEIAQRLLTQWQDYYPQKVISSPTNIEIDSKIYEQLDALGYLEDTESTSKYLEDHDGDGILDSEDNCLRKANAAQKDDDSDGIGNECDNCPTVVNPLQKDSDKDRSGNECDACVDIDWDGYGNPEFPNTCDEDNCPNIYNFRQEDIDGDRVGDVCDNCPNLPNSSQSDQDLDGLGDECDNCFEKPNGPKRGSCLGIKSKGWVCLGNDFFCGSNGFCSMGQEDTDRDTIGDVCDNCLEKYNPNQLDSDRDGLGDVCDDLS